MSIINPLSIIHRILDESHESTIKVNDLDAILSEPIDQSFKTKTIANKQKSDLALEVKNLHFSYLEKNIQILNDINLRIAK